MRRDLIELHGPAWTEPGKLIGNGPFVLTAFSPTEKIELRQNEQYQGADQPTLVQITYRIIEDDSLALTAYDNNEVDMTAIPVAAAPDRQGDPDQVRYAQLETYAVHYNTLAAPFDNPLVRQAFSRAIDRDAYVRLVQNGVGAPALGWLPPGMPGANAAIGEAQDFDPDSAKALLADAYPDGEEFPDVTFTIADTQANRLTSQFIQEQLRQNLGIDIEIETLDEALYDERFIHGDFQMAWQSWFADYADPENWLPEYFGTDGGFNILGYSNPTVDGLFAQAATELDQTARLSLYDQAHAVVIADQPVTPIYYPERNYLVRAEFEGLTTTALDAEPGDWFFTSIVRMRGSA
jgi:oligopeptide transport system substrate-binding protein